MSAVRDRVLTAVATAVSTGIVSPILRPRKEIPRMVGMTTFETSHAPPTLIFYPRPFSPMPTTQKQLSLAKIAVSICTNIMSRWLERNAATQVDGVWPIHRHYFGGLNNENYIAKLYA
jgi:hypothetical protein